MCGLAGFISAGPCEEQELRARVCRMADQIVHRGPDDSGAWVDGEAGIALGSRRLAIVDLSPAGHQPMLSSCGRYVIAFNGEVYNFLDLRRELEPRGHGFRGHSDTEVMLGAIREWGLEAAVKKFVGMFAFALWDRRERALHLVRDRLGIKPLYYGSAGKVFIFGSELKALRAHPDFVPAINRDALALLMRHNYIPQPYSIYQGIFKLAPGCLLTIKTRDSVPPAHARPVPYWSAKEVAESGAANPFLGSAQEATEQLDALLRDAVRLRMIADVPLGAFLSGGVDSSAVVALMQAQSNRPVKTFTIGFHEEGYNEAPHAKAVAAHLGTEHTELYLTPEETRAVIPKLPILFDEPFSDSSQIPTYLISALARRQVTVSLSGDGGDELFGGYPRYTLALSLWKWIGWMPPALRRRLAPILSRVADLSKAPDTASPDRGLGWLTPWSDLYGRPGPIGGKVHKLAEVLGLENREELYRYIVSGWKRPGEVVPGAQEPATILTNSAQWASLPEFFQRMMFLDLVSYLPDDILTKVDRASMGVSLEARVPILDHRVVEFAARLPSSMKLCHGQGKWLLRQVLYQYVPRELIERPKMGFGVPIDAWLRGPLRDWAEELMSEDRLKREGYFHPEPIRSRWADHLSGRRNWDYCLWGVLMFQAWLEHWSGPSRGWS
jgi:asparagine synthase (glutamine-hydrolysing)